MNRVLLMAILLCGCRDKKEEPKLAEPVHAAAPATPMAAMPGMPAVGSAAFHLELGAVYERFRDPKSAAEHFTRAIDAAESPLQKVQAYSALARIKEASGDRDGAIERLLRAMAEADKQSAAAPPGAAPMMGMGGGDDLESRLARLYVDTGHFDQAEKLYAKRLAEARDPWQREQLVRLEVELYRKAGTLDQHIAETERAFDEKEPDESALRFLAAAYGGGAMPGPAVLGAAGGHEPNAAKLIRVYEWLRHLHPEDRQTCQILQSLYERAGKIDEAVKLAAQAQAGPAGSSTAMECPGGIVSPPPSPALNAAAEAVRIRMRAGQRDAAQAETVKLAAAGVREGVSAYVLAAQLEAELGKPDLADKLVKQAAASARSREDKRQVALARERQLQLAGNAAELKPLYAEWKKSEDPCLRMAGAQREQQLVLARTAD